MQKLDKKHIVIKQIKIKMVKDKIYITFTICSKCLEYNPKSRSNKTSTKYPKFNQTSYC